MRIKEITFRHRNDFHYKAECEHCHHVEQYGDGYADHFYCTQVVPNRHCSKCGLNSYGLAAPSNEISADDVAGMEWWNALTDQERTRWAVAAGNTGRAKDAWEAFKRTTPTVPSAVGGPAENERGTPHDVACNQKSLAKPPEEGKIRP